MMVFDPNAQHDATRSVTITGLARGVGPDGALSEPALQRLDAALATFAQQARAAGVGEAVAVATSAVRDASNRQRVGEIVAERLGIRLVVLSGRAEGALTFAGASAGVGECTVVDVGGASTELAYGHPGAVPRVRSLDMGVVRCTASHLAGDPPTSAELVALREDADRQVAAAVDEIGVEPGTPVVAVAATAATIAAIAFALDDPADAADRELTPPMLEHLVARLAAMTTRERRDLPGLHPERADVIVAGGVILAAVAQRLGPLRVGVRDLLDGVAGGPLAWQPLGAGGRGPVMWHE